MKTKNKLIAQLILLGCFALTIFGCSKDEDTKTEEPNVTLVPAVYAKIYGATSITRDGDFIVIKSQGLPDHKSPYYKGTQWESTKHEEYNSGGSFIQNPNTIQQSVH